MCLAIFCPAHKILSESLLKNGFEANGDGAGFAYARNNQLIVEKGFWNFTDFWLAFRKIQRGVPTLVHFRLQSAGPKNKTNCHPFLINKNVAVIHNGTMTEWIGKEDSKKSDTLWFVDTVLKPMLREVPEAYLNPTFQYLISKAIGTGNKMVFLDNQGRYHISRAFAGEFYDDCWFSNESFKDKKIIIQEDWRPHQNRNFRPKNPTEQLLGAPSQLGKIDTGREEKEDKNKKAITDYLLAVRGKGNSVERFLNELNPSDIRGMLK